MSGTEEGTGFYGKIIHDLFIYNTFEEDVLIDLINNQKKIAKRLQEKGLELKNCPEKHVGILMDDLAFDSKMMKANSIKELFFNGRHLGITLFMSFQFMMDIKPAFRTNIDFVFVCRENKKDNVERLYKYYFGMFDCLADFKKVLFSCTNDFGCLVLDNTTRSHRIEDQVFHYKATLGRRYRIGAENWDIWDQKSKKNKKSDEYEDESDEDTTYVNEKKSSSIVVRKLGPKH